MPAVATAWKDVVTGQVMSVPIVLIHISDNDPYISATQVHLVQRFALPHACGWNILKGWSCQGDGALFVFRHAYFPTGIRTLQLHKLTWRSWPGDPFKTFLFFYSGGIIFQIHKRLKGSLTEYVPNVQTVRKNAIYQGKAKHANFRANPLYQAPNDTYTTVKRWKMSRRTRTLIRFGLSYVFFHVQSASLIWQYKI